MLYQKEKFSLHCEYIGIINAFDGNMTRTVFKKTADVQQNLGKYLTTQIKEEIKEEEIDDTKENSRNTPPPSTVLMRIEKNSKEQEQQQQQLLSSRLNNNNT
ncbi:hypothetical protein GQX74_001166 [Glossina fuscipes]|nr:hypothetical protein GQX74_001166 [Glossina fuscipes]